LRECLFLLLTFFAQLIFSELADFGLAMVFVASPDKRCFLTGQGVAQLG